MARDKLSNELPNITDITIPLSAYLFRIFTIRELVQLKCVCKSWKDNVSENSTIVATAQWEDETKDWYFPLRFEPHPSRAGTRAGTEVNEGCRWNPWTWWGIHHSSEQTQRLPPLPYFKWDAEQCQLRDPEKLDGDPQTYNFHQGCVIASSGGLLLITDMEWTSMVFPQMRWRRPLVVYNPLRKLWRMLPALHCQDEVLSNLTIRDNVHVHMVVDEKANAYKVILTSKGYVCVYSSVTKSWRLRVFAEAISFGPHVQPTFPIGASLLGRMTAYIKLNYCNVPSVLLGGRVYYVMLEVDGSSLALLTAQEVEIQIRSQGYIRMLEIDEEAGTWRPPVQHAIRTYFPEGDSQFGLGMLSFWIKIVVCMTGMYAILPATLDIEMAMDDATMREDNILAVGASRETYRASRYVPMQFYVVQLRGTGFALGRVLTRLPSTLGIAEIKLRQCEWSPKFDQKRSFTSALTFQQPNNNLSRGGSWYDCSARGRVIRVIWSDYLIQYDVVTGKSSTRLLPNRRFGPELEAEPAFEYRPTFHMTP